MLNPCFGKSTPEIRALIFDMDGVIIDSNPLHCAAWSEYLRRCGVEMTEAMRLRMYGRRNDEIIRDFLGTDLCDSEVFAHGAAKETLYREMMRAHIETSLVPGIREFLERYRNLPLGVATNAEKPNVDFVLDATGLRHYFRLVIDGHQVSRAKPDPEIYLRVAGSLGVPAENCVVFEDSYTGVAAGLAAGMRVIGLTTTHCELPGVSLSLPDFLAAGLQAWMSLN
ncbi:MAG: HAD family phosphatase [Acidobacteriota bacterium]|nr:HAD family phosphatase [Acidobacteriota bacterium]